MEDEYRNRVEILDLYRKAYRYYLFITSCPEDELIYEEVQTNIKGLHKDCYEIFIYATTPELRNFGRQGYWFSAAIIALLEDPTNDGMYKATKVRFDRLTRTKEEIMNESVAQKDI